ncbi:MAG: ribosome maturation factor RimM [Fimbriimonadaceae bacterium]|nr:ribosome maturation factor RimM [Fimbriimonadaceae bacterium]
MKLPHDHVLVGEVVGVFGLRGALKIETATDFPERFDAGRSLWLDGVEHRIKSTGWHRGQARVRFEEIRSPEDAEKHRGQAVSVPTSLLPTLEEDTYLSRDLIGCQVIDRTRGEVGVVESVDRTVLYDLLMIGETAIPVTRPFVTEIDLESREIHVDLIPGMAPGEEAEADR